MTSTSTSVRYRFGRFELQPEERRLLADGVPVRVGPHAFDLLAALVQRSGRLVSKDELLAQVWQQVVVEENTLQVHVGALRKVLGADVIATVSGRGYRFVPEVECFDSPVASESPARKHNLPHQLTSFIGREKEIAQIKELMVSTRLLTLTGAGGCGKTRLALQIAWTMLEGYRDGVWFVELAPLADSTLIARTVANALAIKDRAGADLTERVAEWLGSRQMLLVLDNAEHLLGPCAQIADSLLRRCGQLGVLVTSRERLGIAGELTYRVPSLSVADATHAATSEEALACEAARLFIDRARLQRPDLAVTHKDAAALMSICRRLDGIALAIELAAPRMRSMSVAELSTHLDDRFDVLTGGSRTALPRHRTLRSLIDWSYDLLSVHEKAMLRSASVFAGGWTVEAAERVCGAGRLGSAEVLDLLTSLIDKNLVTAQTLDDVTRFGMLETVRHYARDRLRERGEEEAVCVRHLAYLVHIAERLDRMQPDSQRLENLNRAYGEHDNVRAALTWCEANVAHAVTGLRLVGMLEYFWRKRGHFGEGRDWVKRLLAVAPAGEETQDHAQAIHLAGTLAFALLDHAASEANNRKALAIFERLGDRRRIGRSLMNLASDTLMLGEYAAARVLYDQALAIFWEVGDAHSASATLNNIGLLTTALESDAAAQPYIEEAVRIGREAGAWTAARPIQDLGALRYVLGDPAQARTLLIEALEGHRQFDDRPGIAESLSWLVAVCHDLGDVAAAKAHLNEALFIEQTIDDRYLMVRTLRASGGLLADAVGPCEAARLWGRAERLVEEFKVADVTTPLRVRYERQVAAARSALHDDAAFDHAWQDGRSWPLAEALRYVQDL